METRSRECYARPSVDFAQDEKFCKLVFDGLLCWPATKAGELVVQPCPGYDIGYSIMTSLQNATKKCEDNGEWYVDPVNNTHWSNYSLCSLYKYDTETALIEIDVDIDSILYTTWLPIIKSISHIGYWISFVTLVFSVLILTNIKKLQCSRNLLHIHLFISFIMRALMFFSKEFFMVGGSAMSADVVTVDGKMYVTEHFSWICKALSSAKNYFTQANYIFILMEGIYLHNLIFLNLFSDQSSVRVYYLLGWGIPLLFNITWVILRKIYDDAMCWTMSENKPISMLIQTPIEISVLINFILFISITRVLFLKINTMYVQQRRVKYRRLIRSTLTLVFIYGVPCVISIAVSYSKQKTVELIWILCDQTFAAFQGLLMGLIYCFLNSEVRQEVRHKYNSFYDNQKQKRRSRTISNTVGFPLQDDPFLEANQHIKL